MDEQILVDSCLAIGVRDVEVTNGCLVWLWIFNILAVWIGCVQGKYPNIPALIFQHVESRGWIRGIGSLNIEQISVLESLFRSPFKVWAIKPAAG